MIYGAHMPPLLQWLARYLAPSMVSILVTFLVLRWTQREALRPQLSADVPMPKLSRGGNWRQLGIVAACVDRPSGGVGVRYSARPADRDGKPSAGAVLLLDPKNPWNTIKHISWSVLPLVAGLFVLVEALDKTGLIATLGAWLRGEVARSQVQATQEAGVVVAIAGNLMNNLPAGLVAAGAVQNAQFPTECGAPC